MYSPAADGRANPWLDLVRALAIALVLLRHGMREVHTAFGGSSSALETIALNGWIGVDLFFVLSGYLIARHLLRAGLGTESFSWPRYLTLRALRIVPAYYAILLLTAAGAFPLYRVAESHLEWRVAYHLAFLQDYLPSDINVVFWSLGVEEKFYLCAPFLILGLLRLRSGALQAAGLAALFVAPSILRTTLFLSGDGVLDYPAFWAGFRSPFHMALEGFVVGVAIAIAQRGGWVRPVARAGAAIMAGGFGVLAAWMASGDFMSEIGFFDVTFQPPLISLAAGALVLGGVMLAGVGMPLRSAAGGVAKLAYCLYLIHFPLLPLTVAIALPHGAAAFWGVYLCVSLLAARALHFAVEKPFLELKDRLAAQPMALWSRRRFMPEEA